MYQHETTNYGLNSNIGRSNCETGDDIIADTGHEFKSEQVFTVKKDFTCVSKNYHVSPKAANINFAQAKLSLRIRLTIFCQQVLNSRAKRIPLSKHLETHTKIKSPKFFAFPIYQCAENTANQAKIRKLVYQKNMGHD